MKGPESKPWRWPTRVPSDMYADAREASESAAKRQARGELRGSSARSASKRRAASSADIPARLDELAAPVELVRVAGGDVRPAHQRGEALQRHPVVGADDGERRCVLALGTGRVRIQQLPEVIQRAGRVGDELVEVVDDLDALVDRLA